MRKKNPQPTTRITITLPVALCERLEEVAHQEQRTVSAQVAYLVQQALAQKS